ncbi:basic proline-rich protein-like [Strigops habroptila]|uniref:basic proline-rich protein-like n=1 Tax=Strigops habroptila TaxID=2489341 RepID=UPI0011CFB2F5|nr:basic proline-rich protein-like [Strigops habroptila]
MDLGRDRTALLLPSHGLLCPYYHTHQTVPTANPRSLPLAFPETTGSACGDPKHGTRSRGLRAQPQNCPSPARLARERRRAPRGQRTDTGAPSPGSEGGPRLGAVHFPQAGGEPPSRGPGTPRPLGGSRRRRLSSPCGGEPPLHLPRAPHPGRAGRPRPPPRCGGPVGQLPSRSRPPPPTSTPAPYPAGACPSGRPLIHLAPLPSELTKPAWQ